MKHAALRPALVAAFCLAAAASAAGETEEHGSPPPAEDASHASIEKGNDAAAASLPWRDDPAVKRHPGSYLGGALGYTQTRIWIPANDSHSDLVIGPLHSWGLNFRVGDAFAEWFALGFQIQIASAKSGAQQTSAFDLMLDATFYPWAGLGLRPSVGIGFGYARGEHKWETGGGGPGCLALGVLYEIRITRLFTIAPVVQVSWITGDKFDGLIFFAGIEFIKWFMTATG
jgi:hypothetical protein